MRVYLLLLLFLRVCPVSAQKPVHIIPEPAQLIQKQGVFKMDTSVKILFSATDSAFRKITEDFTAELFNNTGVRISIAEDAAEIADNSITVGRVTGMAREGYALEIAPSGIHIAASDPAGLLYAFQSLRQMLPPELYNKSKINSSTAWNIPCASISDYPRYSYRGMHLDVSRHFFPASFIKHYLDVLAGFKINVFHWHLTDSHGWRLEIKKYPKLTSVGAWRADRTGIPMTIAEPTAPGEPATYGGFYTQQEVKEIVEYAKRLNIEIIPEIEMPGHCTAALVAYPEFSDLNNKTPLLMPCGYKGDLLHNFCAGYDSTYIFLQDILREVMALFPSSYIHIGGDEVRPGPWLSCPRCLDKMQSAGLHSAKELQAYFTHRIDSFITANGKRMIGWDEILEADIATSSVGMSWHGESKALEAIAKGNQVVMTPYWNTYFDFYQSPPGLEEDITYAKLYLDSVYAFDPVPQGFTADQAKYILGGEACLWTENVATEQRVEYMLLPRLLALSEALWTPASRKSYSRFIDKVEAQFKRFDAAGINYARSMYNVDIIPAYDTLLNKITVALRDQTHKYPVHYTLNGTDPDVRSAVYRSPLTISNTAVLKTAVFKDNKLLGKINADRFSVHKALGSRIVFKNEIPHSYKLCDGIFGTVEPYDNRWFVMTDSVVSFQIELKRIQSLHAVSFRFMEDQVGNIYLPATINISGSADGIAYKSIYNITNKKLPQKDLRHIVEYKKEFAAPFKYIKVNIHNADLNDTREKNMMLLDEIEIQ